MNKQIAKALNDIARAVEAIEGCYLADEWYVEDSDRLFQAIIQDVSTIMFYNRKPQTRAKMRKTPESKNGNLYRNETASRAFDARG